MKAVVTKPGAVGSLELAEMPEAGGFHASRLGSRACFAGALLGARPLGRFWSWDGF
jgi:hypothetical protein